MTGENLVDLIFSNYEEFKKLHDENNDMDLAEADFSSRTLEDVDFTNIDFTGAQFGECNLVNVNFTDCDLTGADFSRANISECNFSGSILNGASFNYSTVSFSNFSDADAAGCNFSEADLSDSDFSTSENLESCRFDEATIWPETEKLPEDFDCSYNYDLSSLREEDDVQSESY